MKNIVLVLVSVAVLLPSVCSAENVKKGRQLFESICAPCHGSNAQGVVGPNIVGQSTKKIEWALNNVGMMKPIKASNPQLSNKENIEDISVFLHTLKK